MTEASLDAVDDAPHGRIGSWRDFADRVSAAMAVAAAGCGSVTLIDTDFAKWPLGQRNVVEAFQQWALASRGHTCTLVAGDFSAFALTHPRWVTWRMRWGHRVGCHEVPPEWMSKLQPTLILQDSLGLRLIESRHGAGIWTRDKADLRVWQQEIDVILQRSHEAMPPTTLGL